MLLTEDADPEARELLEVAFSAESEEDMQLAFDDLRALSDWRREEQKRIEVEAEKHGQTRPRFGRGRTSAADLDAVKDEWTQIALASQERAEVAE